MSAKAGRREAASYQHERQADNKEHSQAYQELNGTVTAETLSQLLDLGLLEPLKQTVIVTVFKQTRSLTDAITP